MWQRGIPSDMMCLMYHKSSIQPPQGLIYFMPFFHVTAFYLRGGSLFNVEKTMVSLLHKELEYKVEKLKYEKVGGHAARDQNQIWNSNW